MIVGGAALSSWGSLQERDFLRKLWGERRLRWPIMGWGKGWLGYRRRSRIFYHVAQLTRDLPQLILRNTSLCWELLGPPDFDFFLPLVEMKAFTLFRHVILDFKPKNWAKNSHPTFKLQCLNLGNYFPYHHYRPTSSHHLSTFPRIHSFVAFIHLITVSLRLRFHLFAHCEDLIFNGCRRPAHCVHILFCSGPSLALSLFSNLVYFSQM